MYLACTRIKGKKWLAIAHWTGGHGACLAIAEKAFCMNGINTNGTGIRVFWEDEVTRQKNYAGTSPNMARFTTSVKDVEHYADVLHVAYILQYHPESYVVTVYPELTKYIPEAKDRFPLICNDKRYAKDEL